MVFPLLPVGLVDSTIFLLPLPKLIGRMDTKLITDKIVAAALDVGFSACGVTDTQPLNEQGKHLQNWLRLGYNGTMKYMENNLDKRLNPSLLAEASKSAIVVLLNYKPERTIDTDKPQVSKYAYGTDYHFVVKNKLNRLLRRIQTEIADCRGVAYVDSAPVLEKALAVKAGLGWIGKNSLLINKQFGSMTFIGTLFVDIPLCYNTHIVPDGCGNCRRCMDACPTQAIVTPRVIDASRCVSYLNKTHRGTVPEDLQTLVGNRIWGCDCCIDVCPYNKQTPVHNTQELMPRDELFELDLAAISKRQLKKLIMRLPPRNQSGTGS